MIKYLRFLTAIFVSSLFLTVANAQSVAVADSVDAAVVKWMQENGIKNAEVAVSAHGTIIKDYAHGWKPTDLHSIGSLSKGITGWCVSRLLDNGKLHLTDTIGGTLSSYFANKFNPAPVDNRFKNITVEQLLTHRSGLIKNAFGDEKTNIEQSFRSATQKILLSAPGSAIGYSNTGYLILGYIVQTVAKQPYSTICGSDIALLTGGTIGNIEPSLNYRAPNGGWNESAVNYAKFLKFIDELGSHSRAWFDGLVGVPGYAVSDKAGDQPPCQEFSGSPAYGLGICIQKTAKGRQFYHDGAVVGKPGGSMFFINEVGYAAVVIFDAEKDYSALFKALSGALTTPAAYALAPNPKGLFGTGGNDGTSASNPCQQGTGAYHKQTHLNPQAGPPPLRGGGLHPCK